MVRLVPFVSSAPEIYGACGASPILGISLSLASKTMKNDLKKGSPKIVIPADWRMPIQARERHS